MMKTLSQLLFALCAVLFPLFVYAQEDTLNADGLFPKYNRPTYRMRESRMEDLEKLLSGEPVPPPADSDMIRGAFQRAARIMELDYKVPSQYIASERFDLREPPINPKELRWTTGSTITSQWIHKDGECILFFQCSGERPRPGVKDPKPNKSIDELPEYVFSWLKQKLTVNPLSLKKITPEEKESLKQQVTFWSRSEAEDVFNAQYVITYPIKSKHSVYMGKYTHVYDLIMLKWGEHLTVSFLVTKKGKRHLDQYIEDVKGAFRFKD